MRDAEAIVVSTINLTGRIERAYHRARRSARSGGGAQLSELGKRLAHKAGRLKADLLLVSEATYYMNTVDWQRAQFRLESAAKGLYDSGEPKLASKARRLAHRIEVAFRHRS